VHWRDPFAELGTSSERSAVESPSHSLALRGAPSRPSESGLRSRETPCPMSRSSGPASEENRFLSETAQMVAGSEPLAPHSRKCTGRLFSSRHQPRSGRAIPKKPARSVSSRDEPQGNSATPHLPPLPDTSRYYLFKTRGRQCSILHTSIATCESYATALLLAWGALQCEGVGCRFLAHILAAAEGRSKRGVCARLPAVEVPLRRSAFCGVVLFVVTP
jgi:hypothetical protein